MPEDEREGVRDIKTGDERVRGEERNRGALGARGKAEQGDGQGERVNK